MRILGVDPGVTTGLALWDGENYHFQQIKSESLPVVHANVYLTRPEHIAIEDFKQRPNLKAVELYSLQVIAIIRYLANDVIPISFYLPSEAKAFWSDEKIRRLGLWKPGHRHAMDALKVVLTHRMKTEPDFMNATVLEKLRT